MVQRPKTGGVRSPVSKKSFAYGRANGRAARLHEKSETRERLQAYFEPLNHGLHEYIGRDLGW